MKFITVFCAGLALAGCSVESQTTPEPNDSDRVNELIEQLGTERSYNSKTLLANPEPDGLVLRDWIARRKATLEGSLTLAQLPATSNPGSISDTLAWERAARKKEDGVSNALGHYELDKAGRTDLICPKNFAVEQEWYHQYAQEHRKGMHDTLVDWKDASAHYQRQCDAEAGQKQAVIDAAQQREQMCYDLMKEESAAYANDPTDENSARLTAARERSNECMDQPSE